MSVNESQLHLLIESLVTLGLSKYQAAVLACSALLGECSAQELAKAAKVPSSRVYEIVTELASKGLMKVRPGRPIVCTPYGPSETVDKLLSLRRLEYEEAMKRFEDSAKELKTHLKMLRQKSSPSTRRSQLLRMIAVGAPSEEETVEMYRRARKQIAVFSRALEYLPKLIHQLQSADRRGIAIRFILLDSKNLNDEDIAIQKATVDMLQSQIPSAQVRYSDDVPIRGSIVDGGSDGSAIILAEERGVPLFVREAAVTENKGLVRGLQKLFDLMWRKLPEVKRPQR